MTGLRAESSGHDTSMVAAFISALVRKILVRGVGAMAVVVLMTEGITRLRRIWGVKKIR